MTLTTFPHPADRRSRPSPARRAPYDAAPPVAAGGGGARGGARASGDVTWCVHCGAVQRRRRFSPLRRSRSMRRRATRWRYYSAQTHPSAAGTGEGQRERNGTGRVIVALESIRRDGNRETLGNKGYRLKLGREERAND